MRSNAKSEIAEAIEKELTEHGFPSQKERQKIIALHREVRVSRKIRTDEWMRAFFAESLAGFLKAQTPRTEKELESLLEKIHEFSFRARPAMELTLKQARGVFSQFSTNKGGRPPKFSPSEQKSFAATVKTLIQNGTPIRSAIRMSSPNHGGITIKTGYRICKKFGIERKTGKP